MKRRNKLHFDAHAHLNANFAEIPKKKTTDEPVIHISEEIANPSHPTDWGKGALLNVRNIGPAYVITIYPEEYDINKPDRSLSFTNIAECQNFVSAWYARESPDPRAMR